MRCETESDDGGEVPKRQNVLIHLTPETRDSQEKATPMWCIQSEQ